MPLTLKIKVLGINVNGVLYTAQAAGQQMEKFGNGGSIMLIASMSGSIVNRVCSPYYISGVAFSLRFRTTPGSATTRQNLLFCRWLETWPVSWLRKEFESIQSVRDTSTPGNLPLFGGIHSVQTVFVASLRPIWTSNPAFSKSGPI